MVDVSGGVYKLSVAVVVVATDGLSEQAAYCVAVSISSANDIDLQLYSFNAMLRNILLLIILLTVNVTKAQVKPMNGATLNYRLIHFTAPKVSNAVKYDFEIVADSVTKQQDFDKKEKLINTTNTNSIFVTVPAFGKKYSWQVKGYDKTGKQVSKSPVYHFNTLIISFIDSNKFRLKVLSNDLSSQDMYLFVDGTRALYDMSGNPLWVLPNIKGVTDDASVIRDFKITPQNTITFFSRVNAYEVDYDGKILWQGPNTGAISRDSNEHYHHEFTRRPNGNYLIAGNTSYKLMLPTNINDAIVKGDPTIIKENDTFYKVIECGTLIEYDTAGNVVWSWLSENYFAKEQFFTKVSEKPGALPNTRTHMNAFFFDEKRNMIYISFRDVNRVIKIAYPSGEVLAEYGENNIPGKHMQGDAFFYRQHGCMINSNGDLYLFNNNMPARMGQLTNAKSSLVVMKEPKSDKETLEKIFEVRCDIDTFASGISGSGGNVLELSNGDYMICMGSTNRIFFTKTNRRMVWNGLIEMKGNDNIWAPYSSYRAYPVEGLEILKKVILNTR